MLIKNWIDNCQLLPKRRAVNADLFTRRTLVHFRSKPDLATGDVERSELEPER
jgi:hypothetical protein